MTFSECRSKVLELLGELETYDFIPKAEVDEAIQKAVGIFAQHGKYLEGIRTVLLEAGENLVEMPEDYRAPFLVLYNSLKLNVESMSVIKAHDKDWDSRTGTPFLYAIDHQEDSIFLYPAPESATATSEYDSPYGVVVTDVDSPFGVVVDSDFGVETPYGEVVSTIESLDLQVFYEAESIPLEDDDAVQVPFWAESGVIWMATAILFGGDHELKNDTAAQGYATMAGYVVERARVRMNTRAPVVHVLGDSPHEHPMRLRDRWPRLIEEN